MDPEGIASGHDVLHLHEEHPQGTGVAPLHGDDLPPEIAVTGQVKGGALDQVAPSPAVVSQREAVPVVVEEHAVPQGDPMGSQNHHEKAPEAPEAYPPAERYRAQPAGDRTRVMPGVKGTSPQIF
jgi:hypothetical protein